jgi:transposase-like protein
VPDPEVLGRPVRRRFTAEYKRRVLREADGCGRGELGALLRREGLYSSLLTEWRRQRERGELGALAPKKRGPKPRPSDPLVRENERLRREIQHLQKRLQQAEALLEVQKKLSEILGTPLNPPGSGEIE